MMEIASARRRVVAVNCDGDIRDTVRGLCRESSMDVVFATFAEFPFLESSANEIVLLNTGHHSDRILEIVPTIKSTRPGAEVVVLSRLADETLWCKALSLGACDLLPSPPQRDEFLMAVARAGHPNLCKSGIWPAAVA